MGGIRTMLYERVKNISPRNRRQMWPAKARIYLAVVAAIVAAFVPVSLISAGASTTACGESCTSPSAESLGTGEVMTVSGSSLVMSAASTSNSAQDFTVEGEGNVQAAVTAGVVSSKLLLNYYNSNLVEFQYAPNGVPSDKCVADTASDAAVNDYTPPNYMPTLTVQLEQCGVTAASLWIVDQNGALDQYDDLINAGYEATYTYLAPSAYSGLETTSPFAEPAVLTVSSNGTVGLAPLSEIGGVISPTQAWTAYTAADQPALRAQIKKSARKNLSS
jgi:hypothetical protein